MSRARGTEPAGVEIHGARPTELEPILSAEALAFIGELTRRFRPRRDELLAARRRRQAACDRGALPEFLPETHGIRKGDWRVGEAPADLQDRRVEITGPTDRKMIINALNSGARVFMADCEDSLSPTWDNVVRGQLNLHDAVRGRIEFQSPEGKRYALADRIATLIVRPRGWHLDEKHLLVDGRPAPGALVDFGLYLFHNAAELLERGSGPYFYLPKLENHREARLWAEVFRWAEAERGLPPQSIKATVLIETILAAFEVDEILYELRDHIVGLNCGRWDYIFSLIKKFQRLPEFVMPDRHEVTMTRHFLRSYSLRVIQACHRRGTHAIGGMAAQIPIKNDPQANEVAIAKVRADKEREAGDGHDGTWVAHPGLVPVALEIFDHAMPAANQIGRLRDEVEITAADLLRVPQGAITEAGLRNNVNVGVQYLAAWLAGNGCVPINHLMEDAATAEISRAQLWQWIRHRARLDDGRQVTLELFRGILAEELEAIRAAGAQLPTTRRAAELLDRITADERFAEFLTLVAYDELE